MLKRHAQQDACYVGFELLERLNADSLAIAGFANRFP
jgi:hypothetical protein